MIVRVMPASMEPARMVLIALVVSVMMDMRESCVNKVSICVSDYNASIITLHVLMFRWNRLYVHEIIFQKLMNVCTSRAYMVIVQMKLADTTVLVSRDT